MVNSFDEWDMKMSEWRGYTLKALEDINDEMKILKKACDKMDKKLEKIDGKITRQTIKVGITSGIMGLIAGLIISILFNFMT